MLARLPHQAVPSAGGEPERTLRPLAALTTRSAEDPTIALLDAWATAADVLTFYQERIANEGYVRTATERRSILELARHLGYELAPGVAASTWLSFGAEDAPGAPVSVAVPAGLAVMSIPAQDQRPQTFETDEALEARPEWNAMRSRRRAPHPVGAGTGELYLEGTGSQLQPGDPLILVWEERERLPASGAWHLCSVQSVSQSEDGSFTRVAFAPALGASLPRGAGGGMRVLAPRLRAALFGHGAPDWKAMPDAIKRSWRPDYDPVARPYAEWPRFEITTAAEQVIDLDRDQPSIVAGSWVVLVKAGGAQLYRALEAGPGARTDFTLTAKTTRLRLDSPAQLAGFPLRDTLVLAQTEELPQAEAPLPGVLERRRLPLAEWPPALPPGRTLVVEGQRSRLAVGAGARAELAGDRVHRALDPGESLVALRHPADAPPGFAGCWYARDEDGREGYVAPAGATIPAPAAAGDPLHRETAVLRAMESDAQGGILVLAQDLEGVYDRATVAVHGNVVRATHGETVREVLGSGDGARAFQSFSLRRAPLTHVPAATAAGAESTLVVRVGGVRWQQVASLAAEDGHAQSYMVRVDDDETARVVFGDGITGARLPTGQENVVATYRAGIGPEGEVAAGQLALLKDRPLGIRSVTNPLPATGAEAPQGRDAARANAPASVLTLDRVVSLQDYTDFASSFPGVGKGQASDVSTGERRLVHVTVAARGGGPVAPGTLLHARLSDALGRLRVPYGEYRLGSYRLALFDVAARLTIDPRRVAAAVLAAAEAVLRRAFSFDGRLFAQPVTAAEVTRVLQDVPGVVMVDLQRLARTGAPAAAAVASLLPAAAAGWDAAGELSPAELLLLNPAPEGVALEEVRP
jgi:predicted phage baseplate assembly protein